jgi:hypothetical protein
MNIKEMYPQRYLSAAQMHGQMRTVTIERVVQEQAFGEPKVVVFFEGESQGLVLNRTNGNSLAALFTPETDTWCGKQIVLWGTTMEFQGREIPTIKVALPEPERPTPLPANPVARGSSQNPPIDW